ncbi:hypothetical protein VNO80_01585 [Phaseolus coccineus]|uniref:Uncharacterized protein n=1 Tax=Phaseolus coccineus TaxID=3886 RepID=A0AAN9WX27_PHACN
MELKAVSSRSKICSPNFPILEETSNLVENGSNHVESGSNFAKNKKEEPLSVDDVEMVVEVKPEDCGVVGSKNCDNDDPMPTSHNEPAISQPAPTDTNTEFVNVLEVENKADEKQATNLLIIGIQTQST